MINVRVSEKVYYQNGAKEVTVYQDFDNPKTWYIVPVPKVATQGDKPIFNLTRYLNAAGDVSGFCTFAVEVSVPTEARKAAEQQLGDRRTAWGDFTYANVDVFFNYIINEEAKGLQATASLYENNLARFTVQLSSDDEVTQFYQAFIEGGAGDSPFSVTYFLTPLTKMVATKAMVEYKAEVAVEIMKNYNYEKDVWGNSKLVGVEISKNLKQSGAGDVKVDFEVEPDEEIRQRVEDWAWTTLERMVAQSVDVATAAAASDNPVTETASFIQYYQENQVLEWPISENYALPVFPAEGHYTQVDARQLVVDFKLLGNFIVEKDGAPYQSIEYVTVNVNYFVDNQRKAFNLYPVPSNEECGLESQSSEYHLVFNGGTGPFNPNYTYNYTVFFTDGTTPYQSPDFTTEESEITIQPTNLGIQKVTFIGSNIPFKDDPFLNDGEILVEKVIIEFFYKLPDDAPSQPLTKEMVNNGTGHEVVFENSFHYPLELDYQYRLTYQMTDPSQSIKLQTETGFGDLGSNTVFLQYPFQEEQFSLGVYNTGSGAKIETVQGSIIYQDILNNIKLKQNISSWLPEEKTGRQLHDPFTFAVPINPDGGNFILDGTFFVTDDPMPKSFNGVVIPVSKGLWYLSTAVTPISIQVDSNFIDWKKVASVKVTLFQVKEDALHQLISQVYLNRNGSMPGNPLITKNELLYSYLAPTDGELLGMPPRYYYIARDVNKPLEFYYTAEYVQIGGGPSKWMRDHKESGVLNLTLPPNGETTAKTIVKRFVESDKLEAALKRQAAALTNAN